METSCSVQLPAEKRSNDGQEDRLSKLPDSILYHILSFTSVNIRDVAQMSILSKRWVKLWASLPHLYFDDDYYDGNEDYLEPFECFVDTVLLLHAKSDLESFRLAWRSEYDPHRQYHLDVWLQHAVKSNVNEIALHVDSGNQPLDWPGCIFTCQSLEKLFLTYNQSMNVSPPKFIELNRLKVVHLAKFVTDENYVERFISGCPVLEELDMRDCQFSKSLDISSHSLKHFGIGMCDIRGTIFRLSAPSLQSFWFICNSADVPRILLEDMSSLSEAKIETDDKHSGYKYAGSAIDLLRGLSKAETLEIDSSSMGRITIEEVSELPAFQNLKRLTLGGWNMCDNFLTLAHFLKCSPYLERLVVDNEEELSQQIINKEEAYLKSREVNFKCPHLTVKTKLLFDKGGKGGLVIEDMRALQSVFDMFDSKCKCRAELSY